MGQGLGCPAISESAVPRAVGGRHKAHPLYREKCCSHRSNHSSAATLAFFHGLESHLLQLQGLSSRPGTGIMLTGTFTQLHCGAKCCREPGSSPLLGLLSPTSSCSVPIVCLQSSAKTRRLCLKQEGGEEGPWREGSCLFLGERMCCALLPRAGQRDRLFTAASASPHSAALCRTHFSCRDLHCIPCMWGTKHTACVFMKQPGDLVQMPSVLMSRCLVREKCLCVSLWVQLHPEARLFLPYIFLKVVAGQACCLQP